MKAETRRFKLTRTPAQITAEGCQPLRLAADVLPFDRLSWTVRGLNIGDGGSVQVKLLSGMQCETADEWVVVGEFDSLTASGAESTIEVANALRYIRYEVTLLEGSTATIEVVGEGRVQGQPSLTSTHLSFQVRDLMVFGLPWWKTLAGGYTEPDCTHCSPCSNCSPCSSCTATCQGCSMPADLYDPGIVMNPADHSFLQVQKQLNEITG